METNRTAPDTGPAPGGEQGERTTDGPQVAGAGGSAPTAGPAGTAPDASGGGFFAWLRALGVPRRAGWLGGVCAGVGARLGIDPIIVRGIVVVLAVLGAPFVLVYAAAWLLLPDTDGEIHFERLLRGTIDPAVIGILILGVVGLLPLVQGGWLGWRWWPELPSIYLPGTGLDLMWPLRVLWILAVVAAIVWFVVWLVRRASADANRPDARPAPSPADSPAGAAAFAGTTGTAAAAAAPASAAPTADPQSEPSAPSAPASDAPAEDLAAWRAQHEAWRTQHAEWRAGQADAARAARLQAAAENKARAHELMAQADAARAARRLSRPRASAAFVFTALGVALIGGAIAAITALGSADTSGFAVPIALAIAVLVLAAGMVVAALRRRRSGALAFFTMTTVFAMIVATLSAGVAQSGTPLGPNASFDLRTGGRYVQPFGDAHLWLFLDGDAPGAAKVTTELTQWRGDTFITLDEDAGLLLDARDAGAVQILVVGEDGAVTEPAFGEFRGLIPVGGPDGVDRDRAEHDTTLVLHQDAGRVYIDIMEEAGR